MDEKWFEERYHLKCKVIEKQDEEIEQLRAEVEEWRACARYDPLMGGPQFKGWDRSQMDRCRKKFIETR